MNDLEKKILESYKETGNKSRTARDLGVSRNTVRYALEKSAVKPKEKPDSPDPRNTTIETETTSVGKKFVTRGADITTLDEALDFSKVDNTKYQVDRYKINSWEVTMGGDKTKSGNPETFTNYQVAVWLKPKTPQVLGIESLLKDIQKNPMKPVKRWNPKVTSRPDLLCELAIYDHHFGMLAWAEECGDDYNDSISRELYNRAIDYLLNQVCFHNVAEFIIPIGHDMFHFENETATTPHSGNILDSDGRLEQVWKIIKEATIRAITRCAQIAPVKVLWVPGNHDPKMSFGLCETLDAWFRKTDHIQFDNSANHRKYHSYGQTLLGFTHGTREKAVDLIGLMLEERPEECGAAVHREWHRGHRHKEQTLYVEGSQSHACMIRQIPSLAAQDKFHHFAGYSKAGRAAKALFYTKDTGFHGEFNAPISALQ